ncbi:MAG: winged helix-turn-helix transcriptional regulator [Rhodospirillales bacterium]|nr:winged helix-turn-helix transcriptional regulator [Rhodospirillales bacterium]
MMTDKIDFSALNQAIGTLRFLANDKLLPILCRIGEEEVPAGELAAFVGMAPSALSQHLRRLREAGLVDTRREHRVIYYRLTDDNTKQIIALLQELYCNNGNEPCA